MDHRQAMFGFLAAKAGMTSGGAAARLVAMGTSPAFDSMTWVSGLSWFKLNEG